MQSFYMYIYLSFASCALEMISIFPMRTFHLYLAPFQQHLHMKYVSQLIRYFRACGSYHDNAMVFNATFNNISGISWRSVLVVEETGESHRPVARHWQTSSHNVVLSTPRHERDSNSTIVAIGTDCKSNYHTITMYIKMYIMNIWISLKTI